MVTITGDWHLHHAAPISRLENDQQWIEYQRKVLAKIAEYGTIVNTGDIVHKPTPHYETYTLLEDYVEMGGKMYSAIGNHDCYGNDVNSLSPMLTRMGYDVSFQSRWDTWEYGKFTFDFYSDNTKRTDDLLKLALDGKGGMFKEDEDLEEFVRIAIVHATVGMGESPYWINVQNLDFPDYDMVVFGDVHEPFEWTCPSGCVCINPGCLIPRNINEQHEPKVLVIGAGLSMDSGDRIDEFRQYKEPWWKYEKIEVESLGWKTIDKQMEKRKAEVDFEAIERIMADRKTHRTSPEEMLSELASAMQFDNPRVIVDEVLRRTS